MRFESCFIKSIIYEANKSREKTYTHNDIFSFIMSQHDMYIDCVSRHTVSKPTIIGTVQCSYFHEQHKTTCMNWMRMSFRSVDIDVIIFNFQCGQYNKFFTITTAIIIISLLLSLFYIIIIIIYHEILSPLKS